MLAYTYLGMCLLRRWGEHSSSDGLRGLGRQLRQMLRARQLRELAMEMAVEMEVMMV